MVWHIVYILIKIEITNTLILYRNILRNYLSNTCKKYIMTTYYSLNYDFEYDNLKTYFSIENLPIIEKLIYDTLHKNMLEWRCEGCCWCCYGDPASLSCKYQCEKIYKSDELPEYIKYICDNKSMYATIKEISLEPYEGFLCKTKKTVWELEPDFGNDCKIYF